MAEQFSLTGFDEPAKPTDRLFFAIFPDAPAAGRIAREAGRLRAEHGLKGKPLEPERFHVTLHHLGDHLELRQDIVAAAAEAAAGVRLAPFEVAFDHAASFVGRKSNLPFVLRANTGAAGVEALQRTLGDAMRRAGIGRWVDARFTPHVTLLYDDRQVPEQAIEPIAWTCGEIVLVHSLIGQHRHVVLGRWPLRE